MAMVDKAMAMAVAMVAMVAMAAGGYSNYGGYGYGCCYPLHSRKYWSYGFH